MSGQKIIDGLKEATEDADEMTCKHENIQVVAMVSRTIHGDGPALLIQALCEDCRLPFRFSVKPGISTDETTLFAPIEPIGEPNEKDGFA